jgi:hypothetical protein
MSYSDLRLGVLQRPRQSALQRPRQDVLEWPASRCLTATCTQTSYSDLHQDVFTTTWAKISWIVLAKVSYSYLSRGALQRPAPKRLTATCGKMSYSVLTKVSYSNLRQSVLQRPAARCLTASSPRCPTATCPHLAFQWPVPQHLTMTCATLSYKCATVSYRDPCHCVLCFRYDCIKFRKSSAWVWVAVATSKIAFNINTLQLTRNLDWASHSCEYSYCLWVMAPASLLNCYRCFEKGTASVYIQPLKKICYSETLLPTGVRPNRLVQL